MSTRLVIPARIALALSIVIALGCGTSGPELVPIRGEVLFNGRPMQEGTVVYVPKVQDDARQASGRIQEDGTFVLTTFRNADGVVPGEYNIIVFAYDAHPGEPNTREEHEAIARAGELKRGYVIPEKYVSPQTSGLSDTVNADHTGFKRIELSG